MVAYLDLDGLSRFKDKMDSANEATYVKASALDSVINDKLVNVYTYKGTVKSEDLLPKEGNKVGDVYDVNGGMNYAWDGDKWDALGDSKVDITIDSSLNASSENPVQNKVIYSALESKANKDAVNKVTQTPSTDNSEYPILVKNTKEVVEAIDTSKFAGNVTINPSDMSITANTFKGNLSGTASYATSAGTAETAETANSAKEATHAATADKATEAESAENAKKAESAENAEYAASAGEATTAATADHASTADSATWADNATSAINATSAESAVTLSTTLPVNMGGTGCTSAEEAWKAFGGGTVGQMNLGSSTTSFLRNDGNWAVPENTTYSAITDSEIDSLFS